MHSLSGQLGGKDFFSSSVSLSAFSALLLLLSHHSTHGYLVSFRPLGFAYFSGYYTVCGTETVSHEVSTESDAIIQFFLNMLIEYLNKN